MGCIIGLGPWIDFNLDVKYDNIYVGNIHKCTSFHSSFDESDATDYEGFDRIKYESELIKENVILVKLNCKDVNIYIELDNYTKKNLKKHIKYSSNGGVNIFVSDDGIILENEPSGIDSLFVSKDSLVKYDDLDNRKIKKLVNKKRLTAI